MFLLPLCSLVACAPAVQRVPSVVTVTLSGSQEVPEVETTEVGTARVSLDGALMTVAGTFTGLSSPLLEVTGTSGHIYQSYSGATGETVFPLVVEKRGKGSGIFGLNATLTPEQIAAYYAGELYLNIHTELHPSGELRGQILPNQ